MKSSKEQGRAVMNQLNSIILEGNVVRDMTTVDVPGSHVKVGAVPVAVKRQYFGDDGNWVDEVTRFDIEVYGTLVPFCEEHCRKGRGVRVVGRLALNRMPDGRRGRRTVVVAEHVEWKPLPNGQDGGKQAEGGRL